MTTEGMRQLFEQLTQKYGEYSYTQPPRQSQWRLEEEEAFAAERAWIKQAFMSEPIGCDEEQDRHPQYSRRYMSRPVRDRIPVCYDWVEEQIPKKKRETAELQAGDTTELDSFLSGFSTK